MNADDINLGGPKPAISMVEESGSNLAPAPAPPKGNKRKNHRGGRKTKKKQSSSTRQDPLTAPNDVAAISTVEATVPALAKKQKQKRKRCRKSVKLPTETTIVATDTITKTQDDVAIHTIKDDCGSPTAQDEPTSACHRGADPLTQDLSRSRDVDEATGARAETSEAISSVEQVSVSTGEGISGETTVCDRNRLEAGFESVQTMAETSHGKC